MTMQTILRPVGGSTYDVAFDGTTGGIRNSTPFTKNKIRIYPTEACYIKFGGSTVTVSATDYDMYLPADIPADLSTGGAGYVAILRETTSGTAFINQWTHEAL